MLEGGWTLTTARHESSQSTGHQKRPRHRAARKITNGSCFTQTFQRLSSLWAVQGKDKSREKGSPSHLVRRGEGTRLKMTKNHFLFLPLQKLPAGFSQNMAGFHITWHVSANTSHVFMFTPLVFHLPDMFLKPAMFFAKFTRHVK